MKIKVPKTAGSMNKYAITFSSDTLFDSNLNISVLYYNQKGEENVRKIGVRKK